VEWKRRQCAKEIILWGVRWDVAYLISSRNLEEMRKEWGVSVAHFTFHLEPLGDQLGAGD